MIYAFEWALLILWFVAFAFGNKPAMVLFITAYWIAKVIEWKSR